MMSPKMKMLGKLANRFGQQGLSRRLYTLITFLKHQKHPKGDIIFSASKITWRA